MFSTESTTLKDFNGRELDTDCGGGHSTLAAAIPLKHKADPLVQLWRGWDGQMRTMDYKCFARQRENGCERITARSPVHHEYDKLVLPVTQSITVPCVCLPSVFFFSDDQSLPGTVIHKLKTRTQALPCILKVKAIMVWYL